MQTPSARAPAPTDPTPQQRPKLRLHALATTQALSGPDPLPRAGRRVLQTRYAQSNCLCRKFSKTGNFTADFGYLCFSQGQRNAIRAGPTPLHAHSVV